MFLSALKIIKINRSKKCLISTSCTDVRPIKNQNNPKQRRDQNNGRSES